MGYGFRGRILRVDLESQKTTVEEHDERFYRTYPGGRALAAYYLLKEVRPGIDPFDPSNLLIFTTSVLTGAPFPGNSRFTAAAKSPLTGAYGESEAGGFWGPELKFAGYDAVIFSGRARAPVYVSITDDKVEIRDASKIWGKDTGEAQDAIREELGDDKVRVCLIGPAGERLVRYACVVNDLKHASGRQGMGAIMGSKNLKGVAVRGSKPVEVKDPGTISDVARYYREAYKGKGANAAVQKDGTAFLVNPLNSLGLLPTRNFRQGSFNGADAISGERMTRDLLVRRDGCFACPVACKRVVEARTPYEVDPRYGGPEYETIGAFGSNCGISDLVAIAKANELCNKLGLDTISTGCTIAFVMECIERKVLTPQQVGVDLRFGNTGAMLDMVERIAFRRGFGNEMAEGTRRLSDRLGPATKGFAIHSKGLEVALHEPRGKVGVGLAYAVSSIGADHMQAEHDSLFDGEQLALEQVRSIGLLDSVSVFDLGPAKVRLVAYLHILEMVLDTFDLCKFTTLPVRTLELDHVVRLVQAVTGWNSSAWELMKMAERAISLARKFNAREGFGRKDDSLPDRFFEPIEGCAIAGRKIPRDEFDRALTLFYQMMGWDPQDGVPLDWKLEELNIGWAK